MRGQYSLWRGSSNVQRIAWRRQVRICARAGQIGVVGGVFSEWAGIPGSARMLVSDVTRGTGEVDKAAASLVTKRGTRRSGPARMSEGEGEVRVREKVRDGLCVVVAVAVDS